MSSGSNISSRIQRPRSNSLPDSNSKTPLLQGKPQESNYGLGFVEKKEPDYPRRRYSVGSLRQFQPSYESNGRPVQVNLPNKIIQPEEPPETTPKLNIGTQVLGGSAATFGTIGLVMLACSYAIPGVNIITLGATLGGGIIFLLGSWIKGKIDKNREKEHAESCSRLMNGPNSGIELEAIPKDCNISVQRTRKIKVDDKNIELTTSASTDKKNEAIRNQYITQNTIPGLPETTQFRCGAIHTLAAAQQYVVGLLLANWRQSGDILHLIDTRYLNDNQFWHGEPVMLAEHKRLINEVLNSIKNEDGTVNINLLKPIFTSLKNSNPALISVDPSVNESVFDTFQNKSIVFHSVNLGPENAVMVHGATDVNNVTELQNITAVFRGLSNGNNNVQAALWLQELTAITNNTNYDPSGSNNPFISGEMAYHTQYLIAKLSAIYRITPSSGCKSNKDRGTSEHIFESCLDEVFACRKPLVQLVQDNDEEYKAKDYSVQNFTLKNDAERILVIKILNLKLSDAVTQANTGKAGNKNLAGLKHLIRMAFTSDSNAFNEIRYDAMIAKLKGESAGVGR